VAEPILDQIESAIQARLAAIVGDGGLTYWFTPDKVLRHIFEERCLNRASAPSTSSTRLAAPRRRRRATAVRRWTS
jgi:hypothetical protein